MREKRPEEVSEMKCKERLEKYLQENDVPFELLAHSQAYTMQEVAAALHVPGTQVAKVVIVKADGEIVMLVISAPARVDFRKVRGLLGAKEVSLAKEGEFSGLFADCATGAMPPFGDLYGVPVYVDQGLAQEANIVFRVGTHRHTMKIAYADFSRLARPTLGEFSM
jgi:Ala-tRNA(Pro) deacylase